MIKITPFDNNLDSFTSDSLTIENGAESVFIELVGSFGRNARDLETLRNFHEFIGRAIAIMEATPCLPATPREKDSDTVVLKDNPLLG